MTLLELGTTVLRVAAKLKVSRQAIYDLKKASANPPLGVVPKRKAGSGRPRKSSSRTDTIIESEVM